MSNRCMEEGWTTIDGRRIRYQTAPPIRAGSAATLPETGNPLELQTLLIHGLGCSSEVWQPTIRVMAKRGLACRVIAPDMPGYGRSANPPHVLGMEELADWLVRFLDDRGLSRVHLAGNSMGCQVGLALARRHPDRVAGLVLQGPTTGDHLVPPWRYTLGLLADAVHESPRYNARLMKMYAQMGPVRYLQTVRKMLDDDPIAVADAVRAPVLVIRGGHDSIVSDAVARRLTASLPDAVYVPLDSAAHAIEFNNPEAFVDAMIAFLQSVERRDA